ncbi:MAG: TRAP transporter small permease [Clostridiales bacterium]|nr:TRAP transporter small permease [Clostridiales bacterium]
MKYITDFLDKFVFTASCILTALLVAMVLTQVICRNLFRFSFMQIEELCVLMMAWLTFLAAAYAVRHCGHVAVDFFFNKMPRRVKYWLNLVTILVLIFLTGYMTYYGYGLSLRQMKTILPITHIPRGMIYLAVPVCSAIMVLFLIDALIRCISRRSIEGVVVDSDEQIGKELESGRKLMEEVLGSEERGGERK